MLSEREIEDFVEQGFVAVRGAVPRSLALQCQAEAWDAIDAVPEDRATWTEPVVRIGVLATPPFHDAGGTAPLREAYDQLAGAGRWKPIGGIGTIPVRFPSEESPGDDGWHLDAGFAGEAGEPRVNLHSHGRALLLLFLFSDVGEHDAPTRVRVGSHRDVPPLLAPYGPEGREWLELCGDAAPASEERPESLVTGEAGDVFLCHPFLVHAAQPHHGERPRFLAQPPLLPTRDLDLSGTDPTPVERAVLAALGDEAVAGGSR